MRDVLRILLPPLVWLASFSAIYGLHGVGCALRWPEVAMPVMSLFRWLLFLAWLAAVLAQVGLLLALRSERFRSDSPFIRWTSTAMSWVGLIATLWTLYPVAVLAPCAAG